MVNNVSSEVHRLGPFLGQSTPQTLRESFIGSALDKPGQKQRARHSIVGSCEGAVCSAVVGPFLLNAVYEGGRLAHI